MVNRFCNSWTYCPSGAGNEIILTQNAWLRMRAWANSPKGRPWLGKWRDTEVTTQSFTNSL